MTPPFGVQLTDCWLVWDSACLSFPHLINIPFGLPLASYKVLGSPYFAYELQVEHLGQCYAPSDGGLCPDQLTLASFGVMEAPSGQLFPLWRY